MVGQVEGNETEASTAFRAMATSHAKEAATESARPRRKPEAVVEDRLREAVLKLVGDRIRAEVVFCLVAILDRLKSAIVARGDALAEAIVLERDVLSCARFAAEWEDDDGLTLDREGVARGDLPLDHLDHLGAAAKSKDGDYDAQGTQELLREARHPRRSELNDNYLIRMMADQLDAAATLIRRLKGHPG